MLFIRTTCNFHSTIILVTTLNILQNVSLWEFHLHFIGLLSVCHNFQFEEKFIFSLNTLERHVIPTLNPTSLKVLYNISLWELIVLFIELLSIYHLFNLRKHSFWLIHYAVFQRNKFLPFKNPLT
jgi:hypothetical protein